MKNIFINIYKFSDLINSQNNTISLIAILSKTYDNSYIMLNEKSKNVSESLSFYQTIKIDDLQIETNNGDYFSKFKKNNINTLENNETNDDDDFENVEINNVLKPISTDPIIISKMNIISPATLNPDYSLSITVENNESFVYLSSRKINDEVVLYSKSPIDELGPISNTYLDTQRPQFWTFEPVSKFVNNSFIVFIRTYSKPYFYLDAEFENGVIVLKAKRIKSSLRQHWQILRNPNNSTQYKIRHLKSSMYLAYSDFDGYLYKSDGSVFLTKSNKYLWNINPVDKSIVNKNVIEGFNSNEINSYRPV
jgi:hypothetical protein